METGGKPRRVARLAGDDGPGELVYPVDLFEEHVGQLVCAVEGGEVGKVVACLKEISRMLLMGATFGEDGMEFVYASPLMQVLVSCLERPEVECRREALLVMREVLGQSCEEIDSFVENGWVPMIVGRVQVGEDVICAGYCVNIMSRCVRNARFASEMRADRGWFEQMMGMSRAEDDSYVKLFAAFLPHLVEVDASLRDVIIEEGNRLLRKSIGEQREPDVWDEIQCNVLEAFYQVIVESEGFMMFVSRECLEMIFIIMSELSSKGQVIALRILKLCYSVVSNVDGYLQCAFDDLDPEKIQKLLFVSLKEFRLSCFLDILMKGDEKTVCKCLTTMRLLFEFSPDVFEQYGQDDFFGTLVRLCQKTSYHVTCKALWLTETMIHQCSSDEAKMIFATPDLAHFLVELVNDASSDISRSAFNVLNALVRVLGCEHPLAVLIEQEMDKVCGACDKVKELTE